MRVGLITPGFSASEEDWCIPAILDLVRTLAAEDDVTVFSLRYPHTRERYGVYGAAVHPFGGAQSRGLKRLPLLLRVLVRILHENRRQQFDVLHALWAHEPGFVAALAGRLTRTPVLVSILGGELVDLPEIDYGGQRSTINRWLAQRALRGADMVAVGSERLERIAARHVASENLVRRPLGVDRSRFSPEPLTGRRRRRPYPGEAATLLNVASLSAVKDQATLLRAFAIVAERRPSARLHVVGDGEARRDLERLARELGIEDRIDWHGAVAHEHLADFYRRADLFVLSSRFESQGMVVLEAAACGCPVVGTEVGVLPELGSDRLAQTGDVDGLAEIMLSALRDPRERAAIATAQGDALERFDLARTVEGLRRTYGTLVIP